MGKVFFEYIYNISFKLRNFPKFNKRPISLKTSIEWVTTGLGNYKGLIAKYFPILSFAFWIFWTFVDTC